MSEAAVSFPQPAESPLQKPFWDAAREGKLAVQRCRHCDHAFLPGREECPQCLSADIAWEYSSGGAKLISWVVYHRAFHPAFADRIPYAVAVVELNEGPRMISNISGPADLEDFRIGQPLNVRFDIEDETIVPRFEPA